MRQLQRQMLRLPGQLQNLPATQHLRPTIALMTAILVQRQAIQPLITMAMLLLLALFTLIPPMEL